MSADDELGLVYLPIELPTGDYYGGNRPGAGLFGESLVALDLKTGVRKWHFQLVHHGIWDFDIPCAPILIDITNNGRTVKALAQPTKQGILYTFDRITGQPIWPFEERPVPKGDVPGEWYSPTQPFPTAPPAYEVQGVDENVLIDFTPELRKEALEIVKKNPFASVDQAGVGKLMQMACELGRKTRPDIKLGICGEHGGDPDSVKFCHRLGLTYVSCSPFRVPVARLSAAQAAIEEKRNARKK